MEVKQIPVKRLELVEVQLTQVQANGTLNPFKDVPQLRGKKITSIEVIDSDTLATCPSGRPNSAVNELGGGVLTLTQLNVGQDESIKNVPLNYFNKRLNAGIRVETDDLYLDFENCRVISTAALLTQGDSVLILFGYVD